MPKTGWDPFGGVAIKAGGVPPNDLFRRFHLARAADRTVALGIACDAVCDPLASAPPLSRGPRRRPDA
ncbi:hypothetical protein [Sphingomonas sp. UYP23]